MNGATVTLTDTSTNTSRTNNTNDAGRYIFVMSPPGFTILLLPTGLFDG